jgi:hypothetical protein
LGSPWGGINQRDHDAVVGRLGPSKLPPAFGIDLHIDDSEGVRWEGERHGSAVLVLAADEQDWADRVREAVAVRLT